MPTHTRWGWTIQGQAMMWRYMQVPSPAIWLRRFALRGMKLAGFYFSYQEVKATVDQVVSQTLAAYPGFTIHVTGHR